MAKKETKTNAMRILETLKIEYEPFTYECDEFIDGLDIADKLKIPYEIVFKTLVTVGKSGEHFVFVIPVDKEIDLTKAARSVGEKSLEMLPLKDLTKVTGYVRGGCTAVGMKKQFVTVIQEDAILQDKIYVSGGRVGLQILINPLDLKTASNAEFADIIAQ